MLTTDAARYLGEVAGHLSRVPQSDREAVLADLADTLAAGVAPADLGSAAEYAAAAIPARPAAETPRVLGLPVAAPRSSLWNPGNPRLFLPKQFGLGWTVNLAAVAVKLGWLRPDDADLDVLTSAPSAAWLTSSLIPATCEAVTLGACVAAWRRAVNGQLPVNVGIDGRPNVWADRRLVLGVSYAVAVTSTVVGVTTSPPGERSVFARLATPDDEDLLALAGATSAAAPAESSVPKSLASASEAPSPETAAPSGGADLAERAALEAAAERSLSRIVGASSAGAMTAAAVIMMATVAEDPERARPWLAPVILGAPVVAALTSALIPIRTGLARVARARH